MSESSQYQIVVEDAGPARKRITVTVPSAVVNAQLSNQMLTIGNSVDIPGFRKGKIPKAVIEKRFGDINNDLRNDVLGVPSSYASIVYMGGAILAMMSFNLGGMFD